MAREKTVINTDLSAANINRRQKTGMHGTEKRTGRGRISKLKNEATPHNAVELTVHVSKCRMFPYNDRILEGLNMENCKSLIDDINANSQLQPVVARKNPDSDTDYEIIFGTRRFFSCQHTRDKVIKIELIDVDDKQAYKIMRSENDERDDTSAYEKAVNAILVMSEVYDGNQKDYCMENNIAEATFSEWKAITDLDEVIVACIPSMFELSVNQATKLRTVINKKAKAKQAVFDEAKELTGTNLNTTAVVKKLIAAGEMAIKPRSAGPIEKIYAIAGDKNGVIAKRAVNGKITIKVSKVASSDKASVIKALAAFIQ